MQIRLKVTGMEDFGLTCFSSWSQVPQTLMTVYFQVTVNYKLPLLRLINCVAYQHMYTVGRQNLYNINFIYKLYDVFKI